MIRSTRRIAAAVLLLAGCAGARSRGSPESPAPPLEVARAFYRALHAKDAAGAARLVDGARGADATAAFVTLARAYEELEGAVAARFGAAAARVVGYADRVAAEDRALRSARAEVQGDRATVVADDHPLATLRRVSGAWRVELEEALATDEGLAVLASEARASAAAAARVAPAVRGGLFDAPEDALEAFRNEVELAQDAGAAEPAPDGPPSGAEL